ncbi:lactadherin-like [Amphiura filiformis]|uniref:lactadherin-like n=1 Tax=Amphiura filiformis TaxID=82378 RepID=UPI003B2225F7
MIFRNGPVTSELCLNPSKCQTLQLFLGNTDGNGYVTNIFDSPIETILIRIEPSECNLECQLRLEILGCNNSLALSLDCIKPSGIEFVTGVPNRHYIEDLNDGLTRGRLNHLSDAWTLHIPLCAELMQVNFTEPMFISGIILQCRPRGTVEYNCVTSMLIKFGYDTFAMEYIKNAGKPKIFHVNHQATYAYDIVSFESVMDAQLIEIQPLTSSSDTGITMRFEILTCKDTDDFLSIPTFDTKPFSIVVPAGEGYVVGEADGSIEITITRTCLPNCSTAGVIVLGYVKSMPECDHMAAPQR